MKKNNKIEIKHPKFNDEFFGFDDIEKYFFDIYNKKRISNCYIFHGIKGVGKATFAYRLARFILNKDYSDKSKNLYIPKEKNVFKNVMNLTHPDFAVFEPDDDKKTINLEKLEILNKFTYQTNLESEYKVVIIDALDDFTTKKNFGFLLKLLEDCPSNCIFLLISHSLHKIPDTIKSRSQKIYFNPISESILRKWFDNSELIEKRNLDMLIKLSNGSLGKALKIINHNDTFEIYSKAEKIIGDYNSTSNLEINNFFSFFNSNFLLEDFLSIIQINIRQKIDELIEKKDVNKLIIDAYILLFFEINEKIKKFKNLNLDSFQILNSIKYIFIKHFESLKKA